ncbi:MAG: DNA polymerase III subunit chi, partial [Magnetococcales bacterium]|nr:DNA polymerase III subunit chi [Magnetococcales bacterium]
LGASWEESLVAISDKIYQRQLRLLIVAETEALARQLDDLLWRQPHNGFLPHGLCGGRHDRRQPILIGTSVNDSNGATHLISAVTQPIDAPDRFDMLLDFVHPNDAEQMQQSRQRYRYYRQQGYVMEYWRQDDSGAWGLKESTHQVKE